MRKMVVAVVVAALVAGMMIPLGAELKTQAQKEYKGWTEVEWTNTADILMGSLTYGYKIKVPTKEAGVSGYHTGRTPEDVVKRGEYASDIKYKVGGDNYDFRISIKKPGYYESLRMTDKGLKKSVDKMQEGGKDFYVGVMYFRPDKDTAEVVNKTQMLAHLFDIAAEEAVMEQLNQSKIPDGLKSAFKSSNSPLSAKAVVAQTGAENYWYIVDGIERYAVWKQRIS